MNIFELIKKEHRKYLKLIREIDSVQGDIAETDRLFHRLNSEIVHNTNIEEKVFYAALDSTLGKHTSLLEAMEAHKGIKYQLQELRFTPKECTDWHQKFSELKETLVKYIAKKEDEIFNIARCMLDKPQIDQLSWQLKKEKMNYI